MTPLKTFAPDVTAFFKDLARNQNRDWFQANKEHFEAKVRDPLRWLIGELNTELAARRIPLEGDPVKSIFRLNRDVRFSNDKSPYKLNIAAVLSRGANRKSNGFLYLHFAPEEMFIASGFYGMEPEALTRLREHIATHQKQWLEIETALKKAGFTVSKDGDSLKRLPRGFSTEEDAAVERVLRLKYHLIEKKVTAKEIAQKDFPARVADFTALAVPLLKFGWAAEG